MKKTIFIATSLFLVLGAVPAEAAKFYKWTDDQGVTHYTAEPPPATVKASEVKVRSSRTGSDAAPAATPPATGGAAAAKPGAQAKAGDKKPEEKKADAPKPTAGQYAEKCEGLRNNLKAMEEHDRVKETNDQGQDHFLSGEEKAARLDSTQRELKAFCE